jgi:GNAT superfamily N-acetyltransferase
VPRLPLEVTRCTPKECQPSDIAWFRRMVLEGGEVNPQTLPGLMKGAHSLGFARLRSDIVGIGALKRPFEVHRAKVFTQAQATVSPEAFPFELGCLYVRPEARGQRVASALVNNLVLSGKNAGIYATSRNNNDPMHAALAKEGFERHGLPFPSVRKGVAPLLLFVRPPRSNPIMHSPRFRP